MRRKTDATIVAMLSTGILHALLLSAVLLTAATAQAQTADNNDKDIFRSLKLRELDYQKSRNYCMRIYGYFRYIDDGLLYIEDRTHKLYRVSEGICELDVRYDRSADEGAEVLAGHNLVHPEKDGKFMDFYELMPYTFLEKARRDEKHFSIVGPATPTTPDTTRIYAADKLEGIAVRDTLRGELRMDFNPLAPDSTLTLNLLVVKARLSNVRANAVYRLGDTDTEYVPQGQLKHIDFDGDFVVDMTVMGMQSKEDFHEHTELYVDSVAYLTRSEYKADRKTSLKERCARSGYTKADIDRLKLKLGVPPLSEDIRQRINEQRDWDDAYELWLKTRRKNK